MRHLPRWILFTVFVVVLVIGALSSLAVVTTREPFPQTKGQLTLSVLSSPVKVLRDSYGIPQIYADNPEDLFAAQGYVHAQDRFFEMDVRRHITSGRLSELFGAGQLKTDAFIRTLGWRKVAEAELPLLSAPTRRYLDAYASGVNAYLHSRPAAELSLEYSVLNLTGPDYTPEGWTATDSVAWLKAMAWDLGSNRTQEGELAIMTDLVGKDRARELYPPYQLDQFDPILPRGAVVNGAFDPKANRGSARSVPSGLTAKELRLASGALRAAIKVDQAIPALAGDSADSGAGVGSNSWAVSGSRSTTGLPILSNDPHLATSIPSIFAQVGLHCRTVTKSCPFDVSGFSFSGMPGVIIGHNQKISWGLTTSYADVQDYYLEEVRDNTVRVGKAFAPLEVRIEKIRVRGEDEPRTITIRSSRHGPLLSDVEGQLASIAKNAADSQTGKITQDGYAVALSWTALTPDRTMDALFGFDRATTFAQFRAAAKLMAAPSQNLIYADTEGNIGYQLPGAIPVRGKGTGLMPAPGWDKSYDWHGTIPFEELPWTYNPPSGYIVTANNPVIGPQYQRHLGSDYSYGWRSQQLIDRIEKTPRLSPDSADQLFYDTTIRFAAKITPTLLRIQVSDQWVTEGQRALVGWDYTSPPDSAGAAYFNVVFKNVLKLTFRDEMPEDLWPAGGGRWYAVVAAMLSQPNNRWWDIKGTEKVETRDDILLQALTDARKEITSVMSRDTSGWEWGKLHRLTLVNQTLGTSGVAPIEWLFNRGDFQLGGGPAVVNALSWDASKPGYGVTSGPTMRMLVDLADLDNSRWVNQSGVSGHAFHRNYEDQSELWANNEMIEFVQSRARVEARTVDRLELVPVT